MSRRRVSSDGLALIKRYEGFQPRAVQLNENQWVIGYGHIKTARAGLKVSRADAEAILREYDLAPVEQAVTLSVLAPMNDHEFDALVSFAYSIGVPAFRKSQVLAHMNSGQPLQAAMALLAWRKASVNGRLIVVDALVRRRAAEAALMLSGEDLPSNAPSQLIHPQFDVTALPDAEADWEILENPYADAPEAIDADSPAGSGEALPIATDEQTPAEADESQETSQDPVEETIAEPEQAAEIEQEADDETILQEQAPIELDAGIASETQNTTDAKDDATEDTMPEPAQAAAVVTERLTRILQGDPITPPETAENSESIDDITEAVSKLADPTGPSDRSELPQPPIVPDVDREPSAPHTWSEDDYVLVEEDPFTGKRAIIDPSVLEPVPEADHDFAEAMKQAELANAVGGLRLAKILYLAGMIIGTLIIVLGLASSLSLLPEALSTGIRNQFNSPVVLIFIGALLLIICGYYFRKKTNADDRPLNQQGFL